MTKCYVKAVGDATNSLCCLINIFKKYIYVEALLNPDQIANGWKTSVTSYGGGKDAALAINCCATFTFLCDIFLSGSLKVN